MRRATIIIIIMLIAGAGFGYYAIQHGAVIERYVKECMSLQETQSRYLAALRDSDASACSTLSGNYQSKCEGVIKKDPSLCAKDDFDCVAIATANLSMCVESTCKAWTSGDPSYCDSLGNNSAWCRKLVTLDTGYFAPDEAICRANAEKAITFL